MHLDTVIINNKIIENVKDKKLFVHLYSHIHSDIYSRAVHFSDWRI